MLTGILIGVVATLCVVCFLAIWVGYALSDRKHVTFEQAYKDPRYEYLGREGF